MQDRIVITAYTVYSPLGNTIQELWTNLWQHQSALKEYDFLHQEKFRFPKACLIHPFPEGYETDRGWNLTQRGIADLVLQADIKLPEQTGLFFGSTLGESAILEQAAMHSNTNTTEAYANYWARRIQEIYHLHGPAVAYGTACAAGNYAIGQAADYMRYFDLDVAIAGAAEPFSRIAMAGFNRSRAMSNDYCKPFDQAHNGMVLGEGAAFFLLEKEDHARQRKAPMLAEVKSLGISCDAYHATAPKPDGSGMLAAMQKALCLANLTPDAIDWVCAHGSGTVASDEAELNALNDLFKQCSPWLSAYKGATGHTLGAATAIELAICIKGLQEQAIPKSSNLVNPMPSPHIQFCTENKSVPISTILNCGYAFGGINSALILSAC